MKFATFNTCLSHSVHFSNEIVVESGVVSGAHKAVIKTAGGPQPGGKADAKVSKEPVDYFSAQIPFIGGFQLF